MVGPGNKSMAETTRKLIKVTNRKTMESYN
jgi:hypothetical protein